MSQPNFKSCSISNEHFVICVLELSEMYDFFHHFIKQNFEGEARLLYADTDSKLMFFMNS